MNFSLPESVVIADRTYPVRTDFRVILEIFVMLKDPALTDGDKTEALLRMFYEERPSDTSAAIQAFRSFADPGAAGGGRQRKAAPSLVDWEADFPLIAGPVNRVLGCECRGMAHLHWHTFLAAYMEISPESVFSQTLRIREKLRSGKRLEKWEKEFYRRNPDLVDPPVTLTSAEKNILSEWT